MPKRTARQTLMMRLVPARFVNFCNEAHFQNERTRGFSSNPNPFISDIAGLELAVTVDRHSEVFFRIMMSQMFNHANLIAMTAGKSGGPMPFPLSWQSYPAIKHTLWEIDFEAGGRALRTEDLRHTFGIRALEKPGRFRTRPYLYVCVRCRQSFLLNQGSGAIVAVDGNGVPLREPEHSRRVKAFASGPCPALRTRLRVSRQTVVVARPNKFVRGLLTFIAFIFGLPRPSTDFGDKKIQPAVAITPADLLS